MYLTLVRPLMEYADLIWDGCSNESTNAIESIQYEAARLVTGAIKGTIANRQSLLDELCWDSLKISIFYKMMNNLVPNYLSSLIPCPVSNRTTYSLRNSEDVSLMSCSTSRFQKSFLPSAICAWNSLPVDIRSSPSLGNFKSKVGRLFLSGKKNIIFEVGSRYASILHTRLRLHNSSLNYDLFRHNCISSPACACGYYRETCKHYLLDCSRFQANRAQLLTWAAAYHWATANDILNLITCYMDVTKLTFTQAELLTILSSTRLYN